MNKKILQDLDTCVNLILTSDVGLDLQYVTAVRSSINALKSEYTSYMNTLTSMKQHLSPVQSDLISLITEEYYLMHLPKLEKLYILVSAIERGLQNSEPTEH